MDYIENFHLKFLFFLKKIKPVDTDIYISTYPRSGTTLMQMALYQLTTDGCTNISHIYDYIPWIERSFIIGQKLDRSKHFVFKTHLNYEDFPSKTKGKFIYITRNGFDVAKSHYLLRKDFYNSDLSFNDYLENVFFDRNEGWFRHVSEWHTNINGFNILYINYEDLILDKRHVIDQIIDFCELTVSNDIINRAIERTELEFMKQNHNLFGPQTIDLLESKNESIQNEKFINSGKIKDINVFSEYYQKKFKAEYYKHFVEKGMNIKKMF